MMALPASGGGPPYSHHGGPPPEYQQASLDSGGDPSYPGGGPIIGGGQVALPPTPINYFSSPELLSVLSTVPLKRKSAPLMFSKICQFIRSGCKCLNNLYII